MKGKLFLRVGLLLFAAILLGSAVTYAIAQPQLAGTEARAQVSSHLLWLLPIALCLAAAGGWAVARGIVGPIRKIDPETPGTEAPYEELVPLLARIRAQNRLIRQQEETLGQTRRDFAAITENMGESFLLLDKRLNVLSRNVSASYLLPAPPDGEADNLNRGGCPEEIVRAAERALAGRRTELTLEMHERYYYVIATPVFSENQITGSVVIALDTTEREQREALRREFSANVSHELKRRSRRSPGLRSFSPTAWFRRSAWASSPGISTRNPSGSWRLWTISSSSPVSKRKPPRRRRRALIFMLSRRKRSPLSARRRSGGT